MVLKKPFDSSCTFIGLVRTRNLIKRKTMLFNILSHSCKKIVHLCFHLPLDITELMCTIFTVLTGISVSTPTNFSYSDLITAGYSSPLIRFPLSWWKNIARIVWSKIFRYLFWVLRLCSLSRKVGTLVLIDILVLLFLLAISSPGFQDLVPKH